MAGPASTISDVISAVEGDPQLSQKRKEDVIRSLRRFAKLSGIREDDHISRITELIGTTAGWRPTKAGPPSRIRPFTKYDVAFALRRFGFIESESFKYQPVSPEWRAALYLIPQARLRKDLIRLARFCSKRGMGPQHVNDQLAKEFGEALADEGKVKGAHALLRITINRWNKACTECWGWPYSKLTLPPSLQDAWTIPLERFPSSFRKDVDEWIDHLRIHGARRKDDLPRPLRPATLGRHRAAIRTLASALVMSGHPIESITSLQDLVEVSHFRDAIGFLHERYGTVRNNTMYSCALATRAIARYRVCASQDQLRQLGHYCRRLVYSLSGLSERNRRLMLQFGEPENVRLLFSLPQKLLCEAKSEPGRKAAVLVRDAVAIELALLTLLRRRVLFGIRFGQELQWIGGEGGGKLVLAVRAHEGGPSSLLQFELPGETADMIRLYDQTFRQLLSATPGDWLFPGKNDGPCNPRALGDHISKTIRRFTGLKANTQLLRHIGARIYLDRNPGHYEVVRRIQGRRSVKSAWKAYRDSGTRAAAQHFDASILGLVEDPAAPSQTPQPVASDGQRQQ